LKFATVRTAKIKFVASYANKDRVARLPLAGGVVVNARRFVFAGIDHAVEVDHDGAAHRVSG
jgi:hypothetical protein